MDTPPVTGKALLASRTFWLNMLVGIPAILQWMTGNQIIPSSLMPYVPILLAAANIAVRLVTSQPITSIQVQ